MKKLMLLALALSIVGCCPGRVEIIDNGPLDAKDLLYIPYVNDSIYTLQHSEGQIIHFLCSRETKQELSYCADCCFQLEYEINTTSLFADTSLFEIVIQINNLDTNFLYCDVSIDQYSFFIPGKTEERANFESFDSLRINSIRYYDVLKLGPPQEPYNNQGRAEVDSLYFNYQYGILKILLSNGEYYTRAATESAYGN